MAKKLKELPTHVIKGIEKSIRQFEEGKTISLEEFKKKHFTKNNL
jgi:hypothetical protein